MTKALFLVSLESAGKTVLAATLGKSLSNRGKKIAYYKPLELDTEGMNRRDAALLKELLDLPESLDDITPFYISSMELWQRLSEDGGDFLKKIRNKYNQIAGDRDAIIIEGLGSLVSDGAATLACYGISELLDALVVILLRYSDSLTPETLQKVKERLGNRLAGVVINYVPANKLEMVKTTISRRFSEEGLKILAIIPEERALWGVTVAELARGLQGEIITATDNTIKLIENLMLGAMPLGSGIDYFAMKDNKAAVISGERSDMQLAALETSTSCVVLTGNKKPLDAVIYNAERKKIPIIVVAEETGQVINKIEKILSGSAFNKQKLVKFQQVCKDLDFKPLYEALDLSG